MGTAELHWEKRAERRASSSKQGVLALSYPYAPMRSALQVSKVTTRRSCFLFLQPCAKRKRARETNTVSRFQRRVIIKDPSPRGHRDLSR